MFSVLPQLIANSIIAGSLYALVAMSFNLIYGVSRTFNLAHGSLGALAAYSILFLMPLGLVPLPVAILAGLAVSALVALLFDRAVFAPLRRRSASNYVLLIASLGLLSVVEGVIALIFSSQFQRISNFLSSEPIMQGFGVSISVVQAVMFVAAVATLIGLWLVLTFTTFGKEVRAITNDEEVARMIGINTDKVIALVFLLGGAIVGAAGILSGLDTGLTPQLGFLLLLDGAIAVLVGGVGNIYGAFLGAYLIGFSENFGVWFTSAEWKYTIAFLVLIIFLVVRPQGFFGKRA